MNSGDGRRVVGALRIEPCASNENTHAGYLRAGIARNAQWPYPRYPSPPRSPR